MSDPQIQNPARLRKPRVPKTSAALVENWRRYHALRKAGRRGDATGLKRQFVPGLDGYVRTPFAAKLISRRRAARKVAHESRRRNRG